MCFEFFIASHYLFAKRKQAFIYIISFMSVLGVALGVGALIVVLGIYNGFTKDIRDKILGANAQIIITGDLNHPTHEANPIIENSPFGPISTTASKVLDIVNDTQGVVSATPFIYTEIMLSSKQGVKGLILRGIDISTAQKTTSMLSNLKKGSLQNMTPVSPDQLEGLIIGQNLADQLYLHVGSRTNILSPSGKKTTSGFQPRITPFTIAGIFHTGIFEYDSSLGFISLKAARKVLGLPHSHISGIEVALKDVYSANDTAKILQKNLGDSFLVKSWIDMNANLFAALKLEKIGMFIILSIVVVIGSFSIVTALIMLVMEKTRDIAILISMGATRTMIRNIFMIQGTIIGVMGTSFGYILGIGLSLLLQRYQFIKLPPGVYTTDHLPILLNWTDTIIIGIAAMSLCFLATIYPARQASRLQPSEGLRYE